jgi:hypothetical protein
MTNSSLIRYPPQTAPRGVIADQRSPAAVDIFNQRGGDTDV